MLPPKKPFSRHSQHRSWRDLQTSLPKKNCRTKRSPRRPSLRMITVTLLCLITTLGLYALISPHKKPLRPMAAPAAKARQQLSRGEVRELFDGPAFNQLIKKEFSLTSSATTLQVKTTLDPDLQSYLTTIIDRVNSRYVGIVVLDGASGEVLALAGFDRTDPLANPCLHSQFPAASIFKIVTATTAMEECGYTADSLMHYRGTKHTLYKRQLLDTVDRYTTTIPLSEAFADSINPVFGKLGEWQLRKPLLEQAAATFGFNQSLDFDLPLPPSNFQISDNPYNWAEVASGFNLGTTLSPLHGAALVTAVLNGGRMVTPTIIDTVSDNQGNLLYRRPQEIASRPIMSSRAATELGEMMERTVISGTARKTFRKLERDKVLAPLQIGGKTGSIDSLSHDVRYDLFVGFARERHGRKAMVVAAMVGHEKFLGIRASDYARRAMTYYFSPPPPSLPATGKSSGTTAKKGLPPA